MCRSLWALQSGTLRIVDIVELCVVHRKTKRRQSTNILRKTSPQKGKGAGECSRQPLGLVTLSVGVDKTVTGRRWSVGWAARGPRLGRPTALHIDDTIFNTENRFNAHSREARRLYILGGRERAFTPVPVTKFVLYLQCHSIRKVYFQ